LLMLLAFWQQDATFLADVMLTLSDPPPRAGFDPLAFEAELASLIGEYRHLSLRELRLGPLLQQLTEISVRHDVRLPAALALIGKAFGQMQLTAAELDPTLDPFSVAASFMIRRAAAQIRTAASPHAFFYGAEKLRVRVQRAVEGLERAVSTPAERSFSEASLSQEIRQATRRIAVGIAAAAALVAVAVTA